MRLKSDRFTQRKRKNFVLVVENELYKSIQENPICTRFGCGKKLTRLEFLYGLKCLKHATSTKF